MKTQYLRQLAVAAALFAGFSASAKMAPHSTVEQRLPYVPASEFNAHGRWLAEGQPLALYGLAEPVLGADAAEQAQRFLEASRARLGLLDSVSLQHHHTRQSLSGSNVHFEQRVGEYPVYNGRIVVHISPRSLVTFVTAANVLRSVTSSERSPALQQGDAVQQAQAYLGTTLSPDSLQAELVMYPTPQGAAALVWQLRFIAGQPAGDWEVLVDAHSGDLHAVWDRAAYATGVVFDPDPLSSSGTVYGQPIDDRDDADFPEIAAEVFVQEFSSEVNKQGVFELNTRYAELVDSEAPNLGFFKQTSPDYIFNREEQGFEAANVFWHVHESMRYINEDLGIAVQPYQYEGGVRFDPHGLDGADNSRYSGSAGDIAFGEGCVDDSEDADVIWHELAHGLHDWVTQGGLSNIVDGLSEGFGDYWAHSYSRSKQHWQPDTEEYHWVFNWDGHNECWGGRITNYDLPWPVGISPYPAIHTGGQIFSTCMMQVYDQIGREKTDIAVLEGLAMTSTTSSQSDAANAIYQAAADMGYSADELAYLNTQLSSCGYVMTAPLGLPPLNGLGLPTQAALPAIGGQPLAAPASVSARSSRGSAGGSLGWLSLALIAVAGRVSRRRN